MTVAAQVFYRETAQRQLPAKLREDRDTAAFIQEVLAWRSNLHRTGEPFLWPSGLTAPLGCVSLSEFPLSRTKYTALFQVYGTTFGPGDGSTTFDGPTITAPAGTVVLVQT